MVAVVAVSTRVSSRFVIDAYDLSRLGHGAGG
jgi:hypothetical protein